MGRWLTIILAALSACAALLSVFIASYLLLGTCTDWRTMGGNYIEREYSAEWQTKVYRPVGRIETRLRGVQVAVTYREPFDFEGFDRLKPYEKTGSFGPIHEPE